MNNTALPLCDTSRLILHSDLNAFYASVEQAERPELRGKPLIVGGDEQARHGIVLTASYEAKRCGVRTGSALWEARRACPDAIIVPPRYRLYQRYSQAAREIYYAYTDLVEPFGPDEAWLDVTHSVHLYGGDVVLLAHEIGERIYAELGLGVSIGISWNKIFAKFGSDYKKPHGRTCITPQNYVDIVWSAPVRDLLYVGPHTEQKLNQKGIKSIGDLALAPDALIERSLGKAGRMVQDFARGFDTSEVRPLALRHHDIERLIKSVGNGITTPHDVCDMQTALQVVWLMGESVAQRLREAGMQGRCVSIQARDASSLRSFSRQTQLARPTNITREICHAAGMLLRQSWDYERDGALRSIGVRVSQLREETTSVQLDIEGIEEERIKMHRLDLTIDDVRRRFGNHAVRRMTELSSDKLASLDPKRDNTIHPVSFFA